VSCPQASPFLSQQPSDGSNPHATHCRTFISDTTKQLACFSLRTRAQSPLQLPKAPFFSSVFPLFLPFLVGVLQNRRESFKSTPIVQLHLKLSSNTPFELFSVRFWADSVVLPDRYASPIAILIALLRPYICRLPHPHNCNLSFDSSVGVPVSTQTNRRTARPVSLYFCYIDI